MTSDEKKDLQQETNVTVDSDQGSVLVFIDPDKERRVVRKLDLNLMPICMAAFILNYLDRSNIGNAKIAGMVKDLHMPGYEFNGIQTRTLLVRDRLD